jgi:tetratricopeptide (TPR) repeat protein
LLAQVLRGRGQVAEARAEVRRLALAAGAPPQEQELRRGGLMAAQLGDLTTARQLLAQLAAISAQRDSAFTKSCYYNLKGALDLASREPESAIENQRRAALFFPSYHAQAALGDSYAARQEWRSSAQAYQRYLNFKGEIFDDDSPSDWVLAHLALARVLAKAGDAKQALQSYDDFLRLWAHADSGVTALREARAERDRLSKTLAPGAAETQSLPQTQ